MSVGDRFACGITTSNVLKCWGYNYWGQSNDGTWTNRSAPVIIDSDASYSQVDSTQRTCAVTTSGVAKFGDSNTYTLAVQDSGVNYTSLVAGTSNTCGITAADGLKCFGWGEHGANGDLTTLYMAYPLYVVKIRQ